MGRSRAAPASAPRASAPPPARTAAPQQHHQQQSNNNTHQQAPPQVTHVVHHHSAPMGGGMSRGPGMLGTMAAAAAGSVAGNYISNSLFSHNNGQQMQPGEQPPQQLQNAQQANALAQQAMQQQDPCKAYFESYAKCLEVQQANANGMVGESGVASCQWAWDMILKCRQQSGL